ncbi:undecaprenyl-diphosphatase [Bacillus bingmayongensis]|uniref:undecaprenyl-diphosphatase n=1 Tax=Bacillus bingmayongensis TaxID=1150157 RepID=UPI0003167299|nr:undecaprenyl-diphosphatase [Bacillus bingmayongensis]MBY0599393.1 undecaprenyl-diphosphatase [Bacillus bingmayongensis]
MNYMLFKVINRLAKRNAAMDTIMVLISQKARYVYLFMLIFMWFRSNVYKKVILYAGVSAGLTLFVNRIIQRFYFKPRPFISRDVRLLIPAMKNSSFPSKHTALAFAIATSVLLRDRLVGSIMWVLAILTGFSRIWVGHHYPFDIIGSAFMGSLISIVVDKNTYTLKPFVTWIINTYTSLTTSMR